MRFKHNSAVVDFLRTRRSVTAKNMVAIAPNEQELEDILSVSVRVPDHGKQTPWRIVRIEGAERLLFGQQVLAPRFRELNADATDETIRLEAQRFCRAGVILAVLSTPTPHPKVPKWEMELSAGALCQNLLVAAQSLGFAAQWLTEWTAFDSVVLEALGGVEGRDRIAGFIYIGEAVDTPTERPRPNLADVVSTWEGSV